MSPLRVLHISNWFAEPNAPHRVPFIREHFEALAPYVSQQLWHVEVQESSRGWHCQMANHEPDLGALILSVPVPNWQLREWLTLFLLVVLRLRLWRSEWDLLVVHIAYPLLRFPRLVQFLFGGSLLLIEHWSAYHSNFQLPQSSPALRRMQGMFATDIPVVAVSQALSADIRRFVGRSDLEVVVVPNAVNTNLFHHDPQVSCPDESSFLMVASWASIKRPLLVLAAIRNLLPLWPSLRLRIIGGGEQLPAMQSYLNHHGLRETVRLLGPQSKPNIAKELQRSTALLHPSAYETFSVVCAEALCCGIPVFASAVGALPELITPENGRLVANTEEAWTAALDDWLTDVPAWDHAAIAQRAAARFSHESVARQLLEVAKRAAHSG